MRSYHLWTIGCQMNEADSRHLASQLEALGYRECPVAEEADLVVLNTCVIRQQAEDKAVGRLTTLYRAKLARPDMVLGLMGCMVGLREAPRLKERFPYVDVFMPPSDTQPLLDFLARKGEHEDSRLVEARERAIRDAVQDQEHILPALRRHSTVTAQVPVVLGCSHACTFCVIPYRRGAERSRPPGEILHEIRALVDQGVREVMLLGQIVDRYGMDLGDVDLSDLLRQVARIDGLHRVRFLTSHPNWMTDRILDTVAELDALCPHIEVAVQAGNNEVLRRMRRDYTQEQFRALVERIRRRIPGVAVNTDIIVGFPGETEDQFMDTYRLVQDLRMDKHHLSKYSERPKTIAARQMPDNVPTEEKERRWRLLEDLQVEILTGKNQVYLDRTVEVLVEAKQRGRWRGRTPDNRLVFFEAPGDWIGQLARVRIHTTGPFTLFGTPAVAEASTAGSHAHARP